MASKLFQGGSNPQGAAKDAIAYGNGGKRSAGQPRTNAYAFPTRSTKIEFLHFNSSNFKVWSFRCKQFFKVDEMPKEQRIKLIMMHLEGEPFIKHLLKRKE